MIQKVTEQRSRYDHLEKMSVRELLENINREDQTVPLAVIPCIPQIEKLVEEIVTRMKEGGRLFYMGAGTSGRLGILDASEIPPTFGAPYDLVIGLIAGGDAAIRRAVEKAEDSLEAVSYTHLRAHETVLDLVCRLLLEKKKTTKIEREMRNGEAKKNRTKSTRQKNKRST